MVLQKQYICDGSIYLITVFTDILGIILYFGINVSGHVNNVVESLQITGNDI